MQESLRARVISCDPDFDARHLLPETRVEACARVDASTPDAPLTWRARAVLDGSLHTLNISDPPSWGAIGCALSHIRLWQRLVAEDDGDGEDACLVVFEDDAVLTRPAARVAQLVRDARDEVGAFDVLLLGYRLTLDTVFERRKTRASRSFDWLVASRWYETHAYCITRRGARALLAHALPVDLQIDAYMATQRNAQRLRFLVPRRGVAARQKRSIVQSSVQARDLMGHCALCRPPPALRNGWAAVGLLAVLLALVVLACWCRGP